MGQEHRAARSVCFGVSPPRQHGDKVLGVSGEILPSRAGEVPTNNHVAIFLWKPHSQRQVLVRLIFLLWVMPQPLPLSGLCKTPADSDIILFFSVRGKQPIC